MVRRGKPAGLPIINLRAGAIDIGSRFHVVAVPSDVTDEPVQTFQAFTHNGAGYTEANGFGRKTSAQNGPNWSMQIRPLLRRFPYGGRAPPKALVRSKTAFAPRRSGLCLNLRVRRCRGSCITITARIYRKTGCESTMSFI